MWPYVNGIGNGLIVAFWCGLLLTMISVAGCGEAKKSPRSNASVLKCLGREGFGIDGKTVSVAPSGTTAQQIVVDLHACGMNIPQVDGGIVRDVNSSIVLRELKRNVQCIREHGFDVTEGENLASQPFDASGVNTSLPAFRKAVRVCRRKFTEAIRTLDPGSVPEGRQDGSLGPERTSAGTLASCVQRYSGTVAKVHGSVGVKLPRNIQTTRLNAMLRACGLNQTDLR